jgi:hypothetical protein
VGGIILWVIADHRRQTRHLADLEARGKGGRPERGMASSGKVESGFPP